MEHHLLIRFYRGGKNTEFIWTGCRIFAESSRWIMAEIMSDLRHSCFWALHLREVDGSGGFFYIKSSGRASILVWFLYSILQMFNYYNFPTFSLILPSYYDWLHWFTTSVFSIPSTVNHASYIFHLSCETNKLPHHHFGSAFEKKPKKSLSWWGTS